MEMSFGWRLLFAASSHTAQSTPHTSDTFNSTWHVSASVCAVRVRVSFQSTIKDAFTTADVCKTFGDCQSVLCEEKEFRPYA